MGRIREGLGCSRLESRKHNLQVHSETESTLAVLADGDLGANRGVGDGDLLGAGNALQRGVEARGIATGEELLRIGALAASTQGRWHGEIQIEPTVCRANVPVATSAGGECFGGVESFHGGHPFSAGLVNPGLGARAAPLGPTGAGRLAFPLAGGIASVVAASLAPMPTVTPLTSDVVTEISQLLPSGYQRLDLSPRTSGTQVLGAVEEVLRQHRAGQDELDREAVLTLGVVVGDVYVRELGWEWVNLEYAEGSAFAVVDPTYVVGNQPMNWIYDIAGNPGREIALVLNLAMAVAGNLPAGPQGDPVMAQ